MLFENKYRRSYFGSLNFIKNWRPAKAFKKLTTEPIGQTDIKFSRAANKKCIIMLDPDGLTCLKTGQANNRNILPKTCWCHKYKFQKPLIVLLLIAATTKQAVANADVMMDCWAFSRKSEAHHTSIPPTQTENEDAAGYNLRHYLHLLYTCQQTLLVHLWQFDCRYVNVQGLLLFWAG